MPLLIVVLAGFFLWLMFKYAVYASMLAFGALGAYALVMLSHLLFPGSDEIAIRIVAGVIGFFAGCALLGAIAGLLSWLGESEDPALALLGKVAYVMLLGGPSAFVGAGFAASIMSFLVAGSVGDQIATIVAMIVVGAIFGTLGYKKIDEQIQAGARG